MNLKEFVNTVYGTLCTNDFEKAKSTMSIGPWTPAYKRQCVIEMIAKYPYYIVQSHTDCVYYIPHKELDNKIKLTKQGIFDGDKDIESEDNKK